MVLAATSAAAQSARPLLDVQQYALPNGLRVVLAPDSSQHDVAVELWFPAGSAVEPPGQWGIAHFFEHVFGPSTRLMANPENAAQFRGRTRDSNAQTRRDYVRYYTLVPTALTEYAIAQAADRVDTPDSVYSTALLEMNRDIVINEGHAWRNALTGFGSLVWERLAVGAYGDHPYGRPLQRDEDLRRIGPADMVRWAHEHYAVNNAVLLVTGGIGPSAARGWVSKYFASIQPSVPAARLVVDEVRPAAPRRDERIVGTFDAPQYVRRWTGPGAADTDAVFLAIATEALAGGNESVLTAASGTSANDRIVTSTSTELEQSALASDYTLHLNLRSGVSPARAARVLDLQLARIASTGLSPREIAAARARLEARLFAAVERIGFQNSRNEILGEGVLYANDAEAYRTRLRRYDTATPAEIAAAARRWMIDRGFSLALIPSGQPTLVAAGERLNRGATLAAPAAPAWHAPQVHDERLPNGLRVLVSERRSVPLVRVTVVVRRDWHATDAPRDAMFALLGTSSRTWPRLKLARLLDSLGTSMSRSVYPDRVELAISVLPEALPSALSMLRDLLVRPAFEDQAVAAVRQRLGTNESSDAASLLRLTLGPQTTFANLARPDTARVTPATVNAAAGYAVQPLSVSLVLVGNISARTGVAAARAAFASWRTPAHPSTSVVALEANPPSQAGIFLADRPGRGQTHIVVGMAIGDADAGTDLIPALAGNALGIRLNADWRGTRQWSYGVTTQLIGPRGSRVIALTADVQTEHTGDAIRLALQDLAALRDSTVPAAMLRTITTRVANGIDVEFSTLQDLSRVLAEASLIDDPAQTPATQLAHIEAVDNAMIHRALHSLDPSRLIVLVIGDARAIQPQLTAAGLTFVHLE
jgi:zinc protease